MKTFLAVFLGTATARKRWDALPESGRKLRERSGMEAWHGWMAAHHASIVQAGAVTSAPALALVKTKLRVGALLYFPAFRPANLGLRPSTFI